MPPPGPSPQILFSAGDVSGDQHGAALAACLRERRPGLALSGLGGPSMQAAGVECVASSDALAIGGLVEVLRAAQTVRATRRALLDHAERHPPDLIVLIDSGGFNLPLARALRRRCDAPILYFVAPQVWAWRPGRIRKIAQRVDRLALILPFEAEHYRGTSLAVDFVGHPLVDEIRAEPGDRAAARRRLGLDPGAELLALAPGSRRNEVEAHLPIQLETLARLRALRPGLEGVLAVAPSIDRARIDRIVDRASIGSGPSIVEGTSWDVLRIVEGTSRDVLRIVEGTSRDVLRAADVALLKPGTVTTEAMLLGRPMIVMARGHPLTAAVVRRLLRVPHLAMPNLVAGRRIVPEYWQQDARPEIVANDLARLFDAAAASAMRADLQAAAKRLGPGGAIARVADVALAMLDGCEAAAARPASDSIGGGAP